MQNNTQLRAPKLPFKDQITVVPKNSLLKDKYRAPKLPIKGSDKYRAPKLPFKGSDKYRAPKLPFKG